MDLNDKVPFRKYVTLFSDNFPPPHPALRNAFYKVSVFYFNIRIKLEVSPPPPGSKKPYIFFKRESSIYNVMLLGGREGSKGAVLLLLRCGRGEGSRNITQHLLKCDNFIK